LSLFIAVPFIVPLFGSFLQIGVITDVTYIIFWLRNAKVTDSYNGEVEDITVDSGSNNSTSEV
jgi:hypothetical protein